MTESKDAYFSYRVHRETERGRILVGNSLTSFETDDHRRDVVLGGSFAGAPTGVLPVRQGARGWIAHEAGPGLDEAGIAGLPIADRFGVPAAAIGTFTSRIASGDGLLAGTVSRVNDSAAALGVRAGMTGAEAADVLLTAPEGEFRDVTGIVDESTVTLLETDRGGIYSCWSSSRVEGRHPDDVFLLASHGALTMALYVLGISPKGVIVNDAGRALDDSGIEGLPELDRHAIAARLGVAVGQSARDAARLMLG